MNHRNSITVNAIFNVLKTAVGVVAPLITYSYIARILGASNVGRINFSISVISYFQLIASLGITNYAISEGAKIRIEKEKFSLFCSEILAINVISTLIAYILLLLSTTFVPLLRGYSELLLINSISMFFTMLGMDWVYGAIEQYKYISIRSIFLQIISVLLVLLLIKNKNQSELYMVIYTFPVIGAGIINFLYRKKFVSVSLKKVNKSSILRHLKPILMIWGMSIASVIYINSDTIMLVAMKGDKIAGLYSTGVKASHVCCLILAAISTVLMPRISIFVTQNKQQEFAGLVNKTISSLLFLIIPMCMGLFVMNKETVLLLGGTEYEEAFIAAKIIAFNIIFSPLNGLIASQIFIPLGKQRTSLIATIIGALLNIILNLILIPYMSLNGAALTTIISEMAVMIYCLLDSRGIVLFRNSIKNVWQFVVGAIPIPIVHFCVFKAGNMSLISGSIICVIISALLYFCILLVLKNDVLTFYLSIIKRMIGRKE